jgi:hypothetical protein
MHLFYLRMGAGGTGSDAVLFTGMYGTHPENRHLPFSFFPARSRKERNPLRLMPKD